MKKSMAFASMILLAVSAVAQAQAIKNWAAPSTWTQATGGRTALIATTYPPLPFIPVTPCRVIDTRTGSGFSGAYGPPSMLGGGAQRSFTITGQCGIPTGTAAVSFNFSVWVPASRGSLFAFPAGGAVPITSNLNWEAGILALGNAGITPLGTGGAITIEVLGPSAVDIIIDINGYYSQTPASASNTFIINAGTSNAARFHTTGGGEAADFYCDTVSSDCFAVDGETGTGNFGGVFHSGRGVYSQSTDSGYAAFEGTSPYYAVLGSSSGTIAGAAGVTGHDGTGSPTTVNPPVLGIPAGGYFYSQTGAGVFGVSRYVAVGGQLYDGSGSYVTEGLLATTFGTALDSTVGPWAVFAHGNFGASGAKHFVEPHPSDAKKVILYSSLEGREVGTYFRGTASIVNGEAVIAVPEDFRMVTAAEGLTIQVTPIGRFAQVYVESQDLNQIVIHGSRDVQFHFMVNGVRRAFQDFQPVQTGYEFMPNSPADRMPLYLTEEAKARLISNGTYNADGTVNMATAERAGFTKIWADRDAAAKTAASAAAKAMEGQPKK